MIDPTHPLGSWFLLTTSLLFLFVFALPMIFAPLTWGRWFRWKIPADDTHLTIYFGRCLGGLSLAVILIVMQRVPDPKSNRVLFELIGCISAIMTLIHIWGAIRRIQPMTETIETAFWALTAVAAFWIHTTLG
jgi:hypothetical protein